MGDISKNILSLVYFETRLWFRLEIYLLDKLCTGDVVITLITNRVLRHMADKKTSIAWYQLSDN
ncbi:hypothetical protein BpHYR1_030069 [Brachionus plicatilis]|uniref:Uncharacterized protein n=1 Tax=Brachionus plicatilis TaxID=10195 RepID=A0A3M7SZ40_BRAPC|nr:hypothetical protein BpHYR1_030069 [Brachionus plicatilis]